MLAMEWDGLSLTLLIPRWWSRFYCRARIEVVSLSLPRLTMQSYGSELNHSIPRIWCRYIPSCLLSECKQGLLSANSSNEASIPILKHSGAWHSSKRNTEGRGIVEMMRQRGRGDADDVLVVGGDLVIELGGFDDNGKTVHLVQCPSAVASGRSGVVLLLAWLFLTGVVDPPFVVYYVVAVAASVGLALRARRQADGTTRGEGHNQCPYRAVAVSTLIVGLAILQLLVEYEIRPTDANFELPMLVISNATEPPMTVEFYRMYNPRIDYNSDIETIHRHLNNGPPRTQRLAIDPTMDVWSSDVFRYEFLQHTWRSTAGGDRYRIICLAESDVVYDEDYIASFLLPDGAPRTNNTSVVPSEPLELAHGQHFWGRRVFEPFNMALLCTSSHASPRTRLWARLASFLHRKRYRRLLYLDFLYALVPRRSVLLWDAHHGCTHFHAHCKYIHFTQPKLPAIKEAVQTIAGC
jgi:hypothetical protein